MTEIEKVNPVVSDGIEFYASVEKQERGMSQVGLARFAGNVDTKTMRMLLGRIEAGDKTLPKSLQGFAGKVYCWGVIGTNKAKIVDSKVCGRVVKYYAYESKNVSEEVKSSAAQNYDKFADYGIDKFIDKITGAIDSENGNKILETMQLILSEVQALTEISNKYVSLKTNTQTYIPGLADLNEEYEKKMTEEDNPLLQPCEDGAMSLEAWLHSKEVTLSNSKFRSLARKASDTYKSLVKKAPERRHYQIGNGRTKYNINVYLPIHFPILTIALEETIKS